jgi:hypothetical protein
MLAEGLCKCNASNGCLMSYGTDYIQRAGRAADFVAKI